MTTPETNDAAIAEAIEAWARAKKDGTTTPMADMLRESRTAPVMSPLEQAAIRKADADGYTRGVAEAAQEIDTLKGKLGWTEGWVGTHAPGCGSWDRRHWECAVRELGETKDQLAAVVKAVQVFDKYTSHRAPADKISFLRYLSKDGQPTCADEAVWGTVADVLETINNLPQSAQQWRAEVKAEGAREATEWQPIESAPRDGTPILLFQKGHINAASWRTDSEIGPVWCTADATILFWPTHWMPIPEPPKGGA